MPEILQLNPTGPIIMNVSPEKVVIVFDCDSNSIIE